MASSTLLLLTLLNTNSKMMMTSLYNLNYLSVLEVRKEHYVHKRNKKTECKVLMFNNKSNKSKYYNHSNFNIAKEYKR